MTGLGSILFELFVIVAAAKIAGEVFDRLGQPPVAGELLAAGLGAVMPLYRRRHLQPPVQVGDWRGAQGVLPEF
jgi:Kef-type K+ transport system membrane component KefB